MRFTHLAFLISISSPFVVYASHILARPEEPLSHALRSVSTPALAPAPAPASGSVPVPVPATLGSSDPLKEDGLPLGPNGGTLKGFPGKASPPSLRPRRARIEKHRRQFHNADFASSGSPPSSDIESDASADEVHERRFTH